MCRYLSLLLFIICPAYAFGQVDTIKYINLTDIEISADCLNQRNTVSEIVLDKKAIADNDGLIEDPLRVAATMPGVSRGQDLFSPSQFYVRGGASDENLFLNNNAKISFPYYFGGQKSIYNSDALSSLELHTGGFPAQYGNALSSVLNGTTRDGDRAAYKGMFNFGFYNAELLAEGPLGKHVSFLVAGRKTYLDLFAGGSASFPVSNLGDITYKVSLYANDKHKISLSGLTGYQQMNFLAADPKPGMPDRLRTKGSVYNESLQWQYFGSRLYSKLSLSNTTEKTESIAGRNFRLNSNGNETGLREDVSYKLSESIKLQTGFEAYYNNKNFKTNLPVDPREFDPSDTNVALHETAYLGNYTLFATWLSASMIINKRIGFTAGLRYDRISQNALYCIAPRLSTYYMITSKTELRVAYTYNYQFPSMNILQQASRIKAPVCIHYIGGARHRFNKNIAGWIEVYRKAYSQLVTFDSFLNYSNNGSGYSQGIELFLRKDAGRFSGWISYGYSIAKRRTGMDTKEYYFDNDQRHIGNLVLQYKIKTAQGKWYIPQMINTQIRVESGKPYTPVLGAVETPSRWQLVKAEINSEREAPYLNINLHAEWLLITKKHFAIHSYVEIWNVTNHKNILGYSYRYGKQYINNVNIEPYYATPILPAGGLKVLFQ